MKSLVCMKGSFLPPPQASVMNEHFINCIDPIFSIHFDKQHHFSILTYKEYTIRLFLVTRKMQYFLVGIFLLDQTERCHLHFSNKPQV